MDLVLGVLVTLVGIWFTYFLLRPKLRHVGHEPGAYNSIAIQNEPGFFGVRFHPTMILGKRIHDFHQFGFPLDRFPARKCEGLLYDKKSRECIGRLFWRKDGEILPSVTLASGESANLILFTSVGTHPRYYVWRPSDGDPLVGAPAPENCHFDGTRDFEVEVEYAHGHRRLRIPYTMMLRHNGALGYSYPGGSGY